MSWVIREDTHTSCVGSSELQLLQGSGIEVIVPPPTANNGRPNIPHMIGLFVADGNSTTSTGGAKKGVVCSDPAQGKT